MKRSTAHRLRRRTARTRLNRHDREEKFVGGPSAKRARKKYAGAVPTATTKRTTAAPTAPKKRGEHVRVNTRRPLTQRIELPLAIRLLGSLHCSLDPCPNDPNPFPPLRLFRWSAK